jgi:hypothetical protein
MDIQFNDDDLNGECLIGNPEGEKLEMTPATRVVFPHNTPAAANNAPATNVAFSNAQAQAFVLAQMNALRAYDGQISINVAAAVSYIRFLAARKGLISPDFQTATYNVNYNDAVRLPANANVDGALGDWDEARLRAAFSGDFKRRIRNQFSDLVCMVAYMFRVRGHHFLPDMDAKYDVLWQRCLRRVEEKPANWEFIARHALHAVMPQVLDTFWHNCVNQSVCSGALIKRYDSAPAGSSGILALQKGVDDIRLVLPGAFDLVADQVQALSEISESIKGSRWGASVNHNYYGVPRIRIDEAAVGVLASVTLGVYAQLAPNAQVRNAPSLKRLAELAPVTGGAIGRMAMATVQSGKQLLLKNEEEEID